MTDRRRILTSALDVAETYLGVEEVEGAGSNPEILGMLREVAPWPSGDNVPWCSAFVNRIARLLGLSRSKSLGARTWLKVGTPVELKDARPGMDVVIFKRGGGNQPGPEVISAPGHVAFLRRIGPIDGKTAPAPPALSLDLLQEIVASMLAAADAKPLPAGFVEVVGGNQSDAITVARYPVASVLGVRRLA